MQLISMQVRLSQMLMNTVVSRRPARVACCEVFESSRSLAALLVTNLLSRHWLFFCPPSSNCGITTWQLLYLISYLFNSSPFFPLTLTALLYFYKYTILLGSPGHCLHKVTAQLSNKVIQWMSSHRSTVRTSNWTAYSSVGKTRKGKSRMSTSLR